MRKRSYCVSKVGKKSIVESSIRESEQRRVRAREQNRMRERETKETSEKGRWSE